MTIAGLPRYRKVNMLKWVMSDHLEMINPYVQCELGLCYFDVDF